MLATPVMINLIEAAALAAVEHLLPDGHQSSASISMSAISHGAVAPATSPRGSLSRILDQVPACAYFRRSCHEIPIR